jgi:hypothetical protein
MGAILSQFQPATALIREICPHVVFLSALSTFKQTVVVNLPPIIPHAFFSPFGLHIQPIVTCNMALSQNFSLRL